MHWIFYITLHLLIRILEIIMASKSKYSNDFNMVNGIAACKWCNYVHPMPKQFSTASLRHHIDKHHPDRFKLIVNIEKEAEKAKTNAHKKAAK